MTRAVSRDKFDYTEWRRTGLPQISIEESAAASNKLASTPPCISRSIRSNRIKTQKQK